MTLGLAICLTMGVGVKHYQGDYTHEQDVSLPAKSLVRGGGVRPTPVVDLMTPQQNSAFEQMESIGKDEYEIRYQNHVKAFQSPNRQQSLRVTYGPDGFVLAPRISSNRNWECRLSLTEIRRGVNSLLPSATPKISVNRNRLVADHRTFVQEYINDTNGTRQNYLLRSRMPGSGEVTINARVSGDLSPRAEGDTAIVLSTRSTSCRAMIRYSGLRIWDAAGKSVAGRLLASGDSIQISINDTEAEYPITVDPIATSADVELVVNASYCLFGSDVSTAGDVNGDGYSDVIVGAPEFDGGFINQGRAYVYLGSASGLATTPDFIAEGDQMGANMGCSVSTAGDVNADGISDIIVGAKGYKHGSQAPNAHGSVFVWHGYQNLGIRAFDLATQTYSTLGTPLNARWFADGGQQNAEFGFSVACAGDINGDGASDIIVGAPSATMNGTSTSPVSGRAYVWYGTPVPTMTINTLNGQTWGTEANAPFTVGGNAIFNGSGLRVGYSVSSAGDFNGDGYSDIMVGAPQYHYGGNPPSGIVSIFLGGQAGISNELSTGTQVWMDIDKAATGSSTVTKPEFQFRGDGQPGSQFGYSVSSAGDVNGDGKSDVVIGAPYTKNSSHTRIGTVYIYTGQSTQNGTYWWRADGDGYSPGQNSAWNTALGWSVSTAGDINGDGFADIIAGDGTYVGANDQEIGLFRIYRGGATTMSSDVISRTGLIYFPDVACAGDVNGDGLSDVIVGSWPYQRSQYPDCGGAWVYYGQFEQTLASSPAHSYNQDMTSAHKFGSSYGSAGDVNGDGYQDVIVGDPEYDNGTTTNAGRVYVYWGSASGLSLNPWSYTGSLPNENVGFSVASAGDVNGDGYSDIIVGSPGYTGAAGSEGRIMVFFGSSNGLPQNPTWWATSGQYLAHLGFSVSTAGDVNGDGFSDIIAGAPDYDNLNAGNVFDCGAVAMWYGSALGLNVHNGISQPGALNTTNCSWLLDANYIGSRTGYSVSTASDFNGDGYSDILIGQPSFTYDYSTSQGPISIAFAGRVQLFFGSSNGMGSGTILTPPIVTASQTTRDGYYTSNYFGESVATAGDVNGDGRGDIIIGAPNFNNGSALVYYGQTYAFTTKTPDVILSNNGDNSSEFGTSAAGVGDVNGDGYVDVLVGAPNYAHNTGEDGIVYAYLGSKDGIMTTPSWSWVNPNGGDCGAYVTNGGDVNADGYSDVFIGCGTQLVNGTSHGRLYEFNGGIEAARPVVPEQYRSTATDSRLVMPGNNSGDANGFAIGLNAYPFNGRGKVKLYCEVKKEFQAFSAPSGVGMQSFADVTGWKSSPGWADVQSANALRVFVDTHSDENLINARLYKWRARVGYHPATMLNGQRFSRWYYPGISERAERNIRVSTSVGKVAVNHSESIRVPQSQVAQIYPNPANDLLNLAFDVLALIL